MSALRYIERLKRIDRLVKMKATGNPGQLARKIGISERSIYQYLNELRELGAPISYSFFDNSYIYLEEGGLDIQFKKTLNDCHGSAARSARIFHQLGVTSSELTSLQLYFSVDE